MHSSVAPRKTPESCIMTKHSFSHDTQRPTYCGHPNLPLKIFAPIMPKCRHFVPTFFMFASPHPDCKASLLFASVDSQVSDLLHLQLNPLKLKVSSCHAQRKISMSCSHPLQTKSLPMPHSCCSARTADSWLRWLLSSPLQKLLQDRHLKLLMQESTCSGIRFSLLQLTEARKE